MSDLSTLALEHLKDILLDLVEPARWLHYEVCEVWSLLIFTLPLLQWLCIILPLHELTRLPQPLIVNQIDIRTLLLRFLKFLRVLLQPLINECFVVLLLEAMRQQLNSFVFDKLQNVVTCPLPLFLSDCFQDDTRVVVGYEYAVTKLSLFHGFE